MLGANLRWATWVYGDSDVMRLEEVAIVRVSVSALAAKNVTTVLTHLGVRGHRAADVKREAKWWLDSRWRALRYGCDLWRGLAVTWTVGGRSELVPIEVPSPRRDEITVEILASVVNSGTERAQYLGLQNARVAWGHRPGFSSAGIVVETGGAVSNLKVGDHVAVPNTCHQSIVTVPSAQAVPVPDGVSLTQAALLQCGLIACLGVRKAAIERSQPFAVVGVGIIGLLALRIARCKGAGAATVIARSRAKKEVVAASGAKAFLTTSADAERIAELRLPVAIEATGDPSALATALMSLGRGGRAVVLGSPRGRPIPFPYEDMRERHISIVGAHVSNLATEESRFGTRIREMEAAWFLNAIKRDLIDTSDIIDRSYDPSEPEFLYRRLASDRKMISAWFDWTLIPRDERVGRSRLIRIPDLSGAGVAPDEKALAISSRGPSYSRGVTKTLWSRGPAMTQSAKARKLFVGMIGCGEIAVRNAAALAKAGNAELAAYFDVDTRLASDLARTHGGTVASSLDALLERPEIDAVFLCVPHHLHAPLAIEAARAGKHVMVEKPPANSLSSAAHMVKAVNAAGVRLSVCFPQRHAPQVVELRRLIEAGVLGDLNGVHIRMLHERPASYWTGGFSGRAQSNWRTSVDRSGGGILIMNLVHSVDALCHLIDTEIVEVDARKATRDSNSDVEDSIAVTLSFSNGAIGSILGSLAVRGFSEEHREFRMWGSAGHVELHPRVQLYSHRSPDGIRAGRWHSLGEIDEDGARQRFVDDFAGSVIENRSPMIRSGESLLVQAVIEAIYRSAQTRQPVRPSDLLAEVAEDD